MSKIERFCRDPKWVVTITCQGKPFYYLYKNLFDAFVSYACNYYTKRKYNTMNFKLEQYSVAHFNSQSLREAVLDRELKIR